MPTIDEITKSTPKWMLPFVLMAFFQLRA